MSYVRDQVNKNGPLEEKSSFIMYNVTCNANPRTIIGRKKKKSSFQDQGSTPNDVMYTYLSTAQNVGTSVLNSDKYIARIFLPFTGRVLI